MAENVPTLDDLLNTLWAHLTPRALLSLATTREDGAATTRMIVLRAVDRDLRTMTFFTNVASEKVGQLQRQPKAELLYWDKPDGLQARLRVTCDLTPANGADWSDLSEAQRRDYIAAPAPGQTIPSPEAEIGTPDPRNMLCLTATIREIDVLSLRPDQHIRATYSQQDDFSGRWISP